MNNKPTIWNHIENISNLSGIAQNLWWLIFVIAVFLGLLHYLALFSRRSTDYSKKQIDKLISSGKYIPGLFVEMSDVKECLRYFIYGKKWKHRLIKDFNFLYDNVYGEILRKGYEDISLEYHVGNKLHRNASVQELRTAIKTSYHFHDDIETNRDKYKFSSAYEESKYLFEIIRRPYKDALEPLQRKAECIDKRYIVLTGSAGNGKTNLLCSITQLLRNLKQPVLFLNAKDIKGRLSDHIAEELNIPGRLREHQGFLWQLENFKWKVSRKYYYIIIDAVNENEDKDFCSNLSSFLNNMLGYSHVKVIVSCRSEYYEVRFRKSLVEDVHGSAHEMNLENGQYNEAAWDRIYRVYSDYFHFTGKISTPVKEVLNRQLLLMRIFFEVYQGQSVNVSSIRTHELFKRYVERIDDEDHKIDHVLQTVARIMLEQQKYSSVDLEEVQKGSDKEALSKALDGSILLEKKIPEYKGTIAEDVKEEVCFTFDEFRDYSLARCLAKKHTADGVIDGEAIYKDVQLIESSAATSAEGIVHYMYVFLRGMMEDNKGDFSDILSKILSFYTVTEINQNEYSYWRQPTGIQNQGVKIILTSGVPMNTVEMRFLRDCLFKNAWQDGGPFFDICLNGTRYHTDINFNQYVEVILGLQDIDALDRTLRAAMAKDDSIPERLIDLHKDYSNDNVAALQFQTVAELFMIVFKFKSPLQERLEGYFYNLPNHEVVRKELVDRLNENFAEG